MNLTKSFAIYVSENRIGLNWGNVEQALSDYKKKLTSETTTLCMCGHELSIGDYVEVRYETGGGIKGKIIELCPYLPQAKVESGWCFHENDRIVAYKPLPNSEQNDERSVATEDDSSTGDGK